ncbi:MAG: ABC transporter ATP-binding protein [Candidatus Odinarchaeota archaeon]
MITCEDIFKFYIDKKAGIEVPVLRGLDLNINKGEFIAILGPSGSGKSTLLRIIAGIELPTTGKVTIDGYEITKMSSSQRIDFLREKIGFMVQNPKENLFFSLNCLSNLVISSKIRNLGKSVKHRELAEEMLEFLNLEHNKKKKIDHLSGGEAQRLALGLSLISSPSLLLLDEPTGNVDRRTSLVIMNHLRRLVKDRAMTIIMVTHNPEMGKKSDKILYMNNGRITSFQNTRETNTGKNGSLEYVFISKTGELTLPDVVLNNIKSRFFTCRMNNDRIVLTSLNPQNMDTDHSRVIIQAGKNGELTIPAEILDKAKIFGNARIQLEDSNIILTPKEL